MNLTFAKMCHSLAQKYINYSCRVDNGFIDIGSYMLGNLNQVLQDSSFMTYPLSSMPPPGDTDVDEEYERIFTMVAKLFGSKWEFPSAVRVNRESRAGFPSMEYAIDHKLDRWLPVYNHLEAFIDDTNRLYDRTISHADFLEKWHFTFIKTEGRRFQETDKINVEKGKFIPRQREVYDWNGKLVTQHRSIDFYPKDLPMFSRRDRLIYGFPIELTIFSGFFAEGNRAALKKEFDFAQHHNAHTYIQDMLPSPFKVLVAADIRNMDQNTRLKMMNIYFESQSYMPDKVKKAHLLYAHSLTLLKNTSLNKMGTKLVGSLGKVNFDDYHGHPTGYAYVSNFNEVNGYAIALTLLHKSGIKIDNVATIERLLKAQDPRVRLKAKGDDHLMSFPTEEAANNLKKVYSKWNSPYTFEEESPAKFLGHVFFKSPSPFTCLDDRNYVVKFLVPEKGKTHIHNMLWKLGWKSRSLDYVGPASTELHVTLREHMKRYFDVDIDSDQFIKMNDRELKQYKKKLSVIKNLADLVFLQDPSSIYKRDIVDELSQETLDTMFLSLGKESLLNFDKIIGG